MTLYCATTNQGKLREFRLAVERRGAGIRLESLPGIERLAPCEETGETFEENAVATALYYSRHAPGLLFAEDSGLAVDALGGAPGVYSARFAGPDASDEDNNRLLLEKMRDEGNRTARFVCAAALAEGGRLLGTFRGVVEGVLLREVRGHNGFGYDPLFFYPPFGCTLAEVDATRKLAVSHRGKALDAMLARLSSDGETLHFG